MEHARWNRWLAGILALACTASAQSVHVVAGDGSGDFTQLYAAVNVAADGDVILVRPHTERYDFTIINGKALTIVGDGAVRPQLKDILVVNLPAGRTVTLRSLDLQGRAQVSSFPLPVQKPGLHVKDDEGCVWLQDMAVVGGSGLAYWGGYESGWPGLLADTSDRVVVVDSEVRGGAGYDSVGGSTYPGGDGCEMTASRVALYGCTFVGGTGSYESLYPPAQGGVGIDCTTSTLFASGTSLAGGDTGIMFALSPPDPTASGLVVRDGCDVQHLATTIQSGGGPATPGVPIDSTGTPSSVADLVDAHRALHAPAVVREGEAALVTYVGQPGDLVLLRFASAPDWTLMTPLKGAHHLDAIAGEVLLGAADPTGALDVVFRAPTLPAGVEALTGFVQPFVAEADGSLRLGGPSSVLIVDASIPLP